MSGAIDNKLLLYTDDTAILVADKQISTIETILENELGTVRTGLSIISFHCT